jgi:fibronectin type 3 domain-containing protein
MKSSCHLAGALPALALAGLLVGCASIGSPVPPSLELPRPPTDLRALRKGSKVYLLWTLPTKTTDRQNVRQPGPTRICRSLAAVMSACDMAVGNLPPASNPPGQHPSHDQSVAKTKTEAEFVDTLPTDLQQQNPTGTATYAVEPLNREARTAGFSNQVQVALAPTLPPPSNIKAQVTADGVVLTWDCERPVTTSPSIRYTYRIYRKSMDNGADTRLADVECPDSHYDDHSVEWQKRYQYRIAVATLATLKSQPPGRVAEIEGDDSSPQDVFTNDIYPPGVPTGLQAVFSGPGQPPAIDLLWAPDTDADLAGYNVYRREEGTQPVKINATLVKTSAYRDSSVVAGKTYWYMVSAVDLRGNESARSAEASESVPTTP